MSSWFRWLSRLGNRGLPTTTTTTTAKYLSNYDHWTRQQLIDRLVELDTKTKINNNTVRQETHRFSITDHPQHRIALQVAYMGWRYRGFAVQKDTDQTVEGELFKALQRCKLITTVDQCNYTRCGRTDKGVSGLGQVVALNVRQYNNNKQPYVETLNRVLPDDIRIVAWSSVSATFHARFDCLSRTYRYMFVKQDLDLDLMRQAAHYMIGEHDFRNFCKLDPSKQLNYTRHIISIDIIPTNEHYQVVIKGTAFLWHQVRYIMSILFLVGQKLESPSIVKDLLDIDKVPSRPDYPLASDLPLVLAHCEFPKGALDWHYGSSYYRLQQHWHDLWYNQSVRTCLYQSFLLSCQQQQQQQDQSPITVVLGAGRTIRTTKYRPLLSRARAESEQVKRDKYHAKLARKQQQSSL